MTDVVQAVTPAQIDATRDLMRAFVRWHRNRHQEDLHLIDAYFDDAAFEEELAGLPGKYAPPDGRLLLAAERDPRGLLELTLSDEKLSVSAWRFDSGRFTPKEKRPHDFTDLTMADGQVYALERSAATVQTE